MRVFDIWYRSAQYKGKIEDCNKATSTTIYWEIYEDLPNSDIVIERAGWMHPESLLANILKNKSDSSAKMYKQICLF